MNKIFISIIIANLFTFQVTASGEKIFFTTTEFPPYVIVEDGTISGLEVEVIRELCRRLAIIPEIKVLPWARALQFVKAGAADGVFMPAFTEERAEYMYYTSEASGTERIAILAKKGSGIKASSLNDLSGMTIGVVTGYNYGEPFDSFDGITKENSVDGKMLLKKLAGNRHPLVAYDERVMKYLAQETGIIEVETVLVLNDIQQFIGFSKAKGKKSKILAEKFSSTLRQMKDDGTFGQIESN